MKEKLQDIFDYYELLIEMKFVDFKMKLYKSELKQVSKNHFLTYNEKQTMLDETYNKYRT